MELLLLPTLQQSLFNAEERPKCTHIVCCLQSNLQPRAFSLLIKVVHFPQVKPVHVGFMLFCCICPCTNTFWIFCYFLSSAQIENLHDIQISHFHLIKTAWKRCGRETCSYFTLHFGPQRNSQCSLCLAEMSAKMTGNPNKRLQHTICCTFGSYKVSCLLDVRIHRPTR